MRVLGGAFLVGLLVDFALVLVGRRGIGWRCRGRVCHRQRWRCVGL